MKRDLINELRAIRERYELNSRYEILSRLDTIETVVTGSLKGRNDFEPHKRQAQNAVQCRIDNEVLDADHDRELLKFIPIATVACIESFFSSIIKELIDFGKPFSNNVVKFNQAKNVKFDFEIINAIQTKTVTAGEFISHILPCNSFEDINSNLSTLIELDFADTLRKFKGRSLFENEDDESTKFVSMSSEIIADLKETFELRNIFCHEFGNNIKVNRNSILRCLKNSKTFLHHSDNFIIDLLYPNAPLTQMEMSEQAANDYQKIDSELSELIDQILLLAPEQSDEYFDATLFKQSIKKWKAYRDAKAKSGSAGYKGGSMYPMIFALNLSNATKEKIENLKSEYEIMFRKHANGLHQH